MSIDVRRASGRSVTEAEDRTTFHSFSFGAHYDPGNIGLAAMVAHNDENLRPGGGYGPHPHTDLEILTWVLDGALRHTDDSGRSTVLAGSIQTASTASTVSTRRR